MRFRTLRCRRLRLSSFLLVNMASPDSVRSARRAAHGLARLSLDKLALVPDPLALVGFGRAEAPQLGGRLAQHLLVVALEGDHGLPFHRGGHARRQREDDGMEKPSVM